MIGIRDIIPLVVGAVLAAGMYFVLNHLFFYPEQRDLGKQEYIAEQIVNDKKNELKRDNDDAKIRGMSDYDVCVTYLGKLPDCEALKQL